MADNPANFLRRAGYGFLQARGDKQDSFARRLYSSAFPRLHVYVNDRGDKWEFHLHLDQKPVSYEGSNAHSGEYEGPILEEEIGRLKREAGIRNQASAVGSQAPGSGKREAGSGKPNIERGARKISSLGRSASAEERLGQGNLDEAGVAEKKKSFWRKLFS